MDKIERSLRELMNNIAEEQNYEEYKFNVKMLPSAYQGNTSVLYAVTISSVGKEDLALAVKFSAVTEKGRSTVPVYMYEIEQYFYSDFFPKYKKIEKEREVAEEDRFVIPKFYGYNSKLYEEALVLENLIAKGFTPRDKLKPMDWSYASGAVETLAKFHAASIAYSEEYPAEFEKLYEKCNSQIETLFRNVGDHCNPYFFEMALKEVKEENRNRLASFFERYEKLHFFTLPINRRKSVLTHEDYGHTNLMYKVKEDGKVQVIPIDFQIIRIGCMIRDLLFFIFSGSDEAFRAQYYEQLVEYYYQQLRRALQVLKINPDKVYPREDFDFELEETLPYGLLVAVLYLPNLMRRETLQPDKLLESLLSINPSPLYSERLNGIVNDFVRWNVI